jgi:hypothetical protein
MLIVIPTRNRIKELTNTLNFLDSNKFFFERIIIVDSSELEIKKKETTLARYKMKMVN